MKKVINERLEMVLRELNQVDEKNETLFAIQITKEFSFICTNIEKSNLKIPENLKMDGKIIKMENRTYEIIYLSK